MAEILSNNQAKLNKDKTELIWLDEDAKKDYFAVISAMKDVTPRVTSPPKPGGEFESRREHRSSQRSVNPNR